MSKETVPAIHGPLPGPLAKALIERDEQFTSPSYTREYPLAVKSGRGAVIEDLDGNLFLDFTAGIAVCATGHCHPRVVSAIKNQADQLLHMSGTDFYYPPRPTWQSDWPKSRLAIRQKKSSLPTPARKRWRPRLSWRGSTPSGST